MMKRFVKVAAAIGWVVFARLSADALVSELNDRKCVVVPLSVDGKRVADVPLRFKEIPKELSGKSLVIATRGSREAPGQGFQFVLNKNATLYLFVMERGKPTVPSEWRKTRLTTAFYYDDTATFKDQVYFREAVAGEKIVVPANDGQEASTYGIPHCVLIDTK